MPTRSTKLYSGKPAAGVSTLAITAPPGFTLLVKSVLAMNLSGAVDNVQVWVQDAGATTSWLIYSTATPANTRLEWNGWVALNPGESLFVFSLNATTYFWVSGTKLPGVA